MKELLLCALMVGPVESPPPRRAYIVWAEGDFASEVHYKEWHRDKWVLRFMRMQTLDHYDVRWLEVSETAHDASDCPMIVLDRETIKLHSHNVSGESIREVYLRLREARAERPEQERWEYQDVPVPGLIEEESDE